MSHHRSQNQVSQAHLLCCCVAFGVDLLPYPWYPGNLSKTQIASQRVLSQNTTTHCAPDFTKEADGWVCNICNPSRGDRAHMNIHAAIRHERNSAQHARNVQESNMWWNPPNEDAAISWLPSSQDAAIWNAPLEVRHNT